MGIEPTFTAWKAVVIATIPYLHMERIEGIEPSTKPWQGFVLPLNYIRILVLVAGLEPARYCYHGILSPGCLPIPPHEHINKTFIFGLVAFANSAIPLYLSGELRFELRSQLRPRGLVSITKNILQKKSLFLSYIYIILYFL